MEVPDPSKELGRCANIWISWGEEVRYLMPFEEDVRNILDIDMELIPNALSGTGLSTFGYGV